MIKNKIIIIASLIPVLLFVMPCQSFSQTVIDNGIQQQLSVEAIHHNTTDSMLLKNPSKANAIKFTYGISRQMIKRKTSFSAGYEKGRFENSSPSITQHSVTFILSDGFNIIPRVKNISAYLGYSLSSNPSFTVGKNIYSWNSSSLVSFYQSYEYKIKKQAIIFSLSIPLAGAVYRPKQNYASTDKNFNRVVSTFYSNPSFSSLNNYRAIDFSLMYKIDITRHLGLAAQYSFGYKKWTGPGAFTDKKHGAGLSLVYKFFN